MYKYQPPKSSIWGHGLRKMRPAESRSRVKKFLDIAAGEHCFVGGSVFYQPTLDTIFRQDLHKDCLSRFSRLLGIEESPQFLSNLDNQQVELCLDELSRDDSLYVPGGHGAVVMEGVRISKWRINDQETSTNSIVDIYYGANSRISTFLTFNDPEEFEFVRQALMEAGLCRLNEKHLKQLRGKKAS